MCGIVGYIGPKQAATVLLTGLEKLEYRGYDSAGLAVIQNKQIQLIKAKGRLQRLIDQTDAGRLVPGHVGIGHTRWATHGEPSDVNSHPHLSQSARYAIVHNGIIENDRALKTWLQEKGFHFISETDSEVIAHLFEYYASEDLIGTLIKVLSHLEGSYALGVLDTAQPDRFVAVRKGSPLIVGLGAGEQFIASDIPALLQHTRDVYLIEDNEIVEVTADGVMLYNLHHERITKEIFHVDWDVSAAEKGGYEHFMMKEIMEQPQVLAETIRAYTKDDTIQFGNTKFTKAQMSALRTLHIVACGSAFHVAVYAKYIIEQIARIPVAVDIASEFRYRDPLLSKDDLVLVISQSGETADTLEALRESKRKGARVIALLNVVGSSMAREADDVIYTLAGPEISVATTKAYVCQLAVMTLFAYHLAELRGLITSVTRRTFLRDMHRLPAYCEAILQKKDYIQAVAAQLYNQKDIYFIGRASDYALSLEASLKLKEISYIHSEATPAGELKHGPISLIEPHTLVVALATCAPLATKLKNNVIEVRTRGAQSLILTTDTLKPLFNDVADHFFLLPDAPACILPILSILPMQLFAYYIAVLNGRDVDKPRNLAKSVTVE